MRLMRPDDFRHHLRRHPFRPIRVYVSDGATYDVNHPELMLLTLTEAVIAIDPGNDQLPDRYVYCDPIHITRIEPMDVDRMDGPTRGGNGTSKNE